MSQIRALREFSFFTRAIGGGGVLEEDSRTRRGRRNAYHVYHRTRTLVTFNTEADINVTLQHLDLVCVCAEK
jgi:hypothetical protein